MKIYEFSVRVIGCGNTPEEAWEGLLEDGMFNFEDGNYSIPEKEDIKLLGEEDD